MVFNGPKKSVNLGNFGQFPGGVAWGVPAPPSSLFLALECGEHFGKAGKRCGCFSVPVFAEAQGSPW